MPRFTKFRQYLFVLLLSTIISISFTPQAQAADLTFPGDWIINTPTAINSKTIVVNGNVIINSALNLTNSILTIRSSLDGEHGIFVVSGGSIRLSQSTAQAAVVDGAHRFTFSVASGATLWVKHSSLIDVSIVQIEANDPRFEKNTITGASFPITLIGVNGGKISGNVITPGPAALRAIGIRSLSSSSFEVRSNTVTGYDIGIYLESSTGVKVGPKNKVDGGQHNIFLVSSSGNHIFENKLGGNTVSGITITSSTDNKITKNKLSPGGSIGIAFLASSNNLAKKNDVSGYDFGLFLSSSQLNKIHNNHVKDVAIHGIAVVDASHGNEVKDNKIRSAGGAGIFILISNEVTIRKNDIKNALNGIYVSQSQEGDISGNIVKDNSSFGIILDSSTKMLVDSNKAEKNSIGIFLTHSSFNEIIRNKLKDNVDNMALEASNNNHVVKNKIEKAKGFGLNLVQSSTNLIEDNDIEKNTIIGLFVSSSNTNTIKKNKINENQIGALLTASSSNVFLKNHIKKNEISGIAITAASQFNIIEDNKIDSNGLRGILIDNSNGNLIQGNSLKKNGEGLVELGYGIYMIAATNTQVLENKISDNGDTGVTVTSGSDNTVVKDNLIKGHRFGIFFDNSINIDILTNDFKDNEEDTHTPP